MVEMNLTQYLHQHFEAHQNDDGAVSQSTAARAASMKKQISVMSLNDAVSNLSLQQEEGSGNESNEESVARCLTQYIDAVMAVELSSETRESVEQVFDLASGLAVVCSEHATEAIAVRAMEFSAVLLERVRVQACLLIGSMASHLSEKDEEWISEWMDALKDALLPRLTDKSQAVRLSAIKASTYFFADEKNSRELLEILLWNMWHDPSVANRVAAVDALPISLDTVDHVIARIRDIKEKVRVQALEVLQTKVDPVTQLNQDHFAEIVKSGLSARCEATKNATVKLICSRWMKAAKFNPVTLLKMMGAAVNEEECEQAIEVLLEIARSGERDALNQLSDPEIRAFRASVESHLVRLSESGVTFDAEELFFARIACSTAQGSTALTPAQKEGVVNKVAPDIPILCELFQRHSLRLVEALKKGDREQEDEECFVCLQLLQLAKVAGLHEEGSRRHFSSVMKAMLSSAETPDDLIEGCMQSLRAAYQYENEYLEIVSQIVSEMVAVEDTSSSNELDQLRTLRVLSIITILLENASSIISTHPLLQDFAQIIVAAVTDANALAREAGVSCLGKLGLFTEEAAVLHEYKPLLLNVAANESEKVEIRSQAILALSDWSLLFSEILQPCQVDDTSVSFLEIVKDMMQHPNPSVGAIAAEVAAKLLFAGRVCESSLIAHLLVTFFNPSQDKSDDGDIKEVGSSVRLQQLLSLFFPAYCIKLEHGRDAMIGAIDCALGLANNKPSKKRSRKVAFPLIKMVEYVCSVVDTGRESAASSASSIPTTPRATKDQPETIKSSTALLACIQVALFLINESSLTVTQTRGFSKFIGNQEIEVASEENAHLRELKRLMEELGMIVTDVSSLRSLALLNEHIIDVESDEEDIEEEDNENRGDASSQGTVAEDEEDELENNADAESDGGTTLEDSLMESLAGLSVRNKENLKASSGGKISTSNRRSNPRRSAGTLSVRDSLGSIGH